MSEPITPTPFTAEQIRDASPSGRLITTRMTDEAEAHTYWQSRFTECDEKGALIENRPVSSDGDLIGEAERARATWEQLRDHASFPGPATSISDEEITTELGPLQCHRYEVERGEATDLFWFASGRPGPPVRTATRHNGKERVTTEIIADTSAVQARQSPG